MPEPRVVAIAIQLTPEQKELLKRASGADCSEVVLVRPRRRSRATANELTSPADAELAKVLWRAHQQFQADAKDKPNAARRRERLGFRSPPSLLLVR